MPNIKISNALLNKIKQQSTVPVKTFKKKKMDAQTLDAMEKDVIKKPTEQNVSTFMEIYEKEILKEFEHPVKILAKQTEKIMNIQAMVETEMQKSFASGYIDVQMVEAYRRLSDSVLKYVMEMKSEWDIAIETEVDETVIESILDLEVFFEFLADKDPALVEQFIEFRMSKLMSRPPADINIIDADAEKTE